MINGFIVRSKLRNFLKFPVEDSYKFNLQKRIIAVADGVTRDFLDNTLINRSLRSLIKFLMRLYPDPSPARDASNIFCSGFLTYFNYYNNVNDKTMKRAFERTNNLIQKYNNVKFNNINYLANDFAGCVASATYEQFQDGQIILNYGFISGCGVAIFDKKGNLKFRTPNEGPNSKGSIEDNLIQRFGLKFSDEEGRKIIRNYYRNNPEEPLSYGVLTGEKSALQYVRVGKEEIIPEDFYCVYSDGVELAIFKDNDVNGFFADKLRKYDINGLEKLCKRKIKLEGTLVVAQVD